MEKDKHLIKKGGFTLIEVLIVITIISLAGIVTMTTMGIGKTRNNLKIAQREVSAVIKLAQSYALQGKTVSSGETPCGFGFTFIDDTHYQIFYIPSGGGTDCKTKNESSSYRKYLDDSDSPAFEEFELNNKIILKAGTNNCATQVYFTVPHASLYNCYGNVFSQASFQLTNVDGSQSRTINIDQTGIISEEE